MKYLATTTIRKGIFADNSDNRKSDKISTWVLPFLGSSPWCYPMGTKMATSSIKCQRQLETVSRAAKGRPARLGDSPSHGKSTFALCEHPTAHIQGYIMYTINVHKLIKIFRWNCIFKRKKSWKFVYIIAIQ